MPNDCFLTSATPITRIVAEPAPAQRTAASRPSRTGAVLAASALGGLVLAGMTVWLLEQAGRDDRTSGQAASVGAPLAAPTAMTQLMAPIPAAVMTPMAPLANAKPGPAPGTATSRTGASGSHSARASAAKATTTHAVSAARSPSAASKTASRGAAHPPQKKTQRSTTSKRTRIASSRER